MSAMDHPTLLTRLVIGCERALQMRQDEDPEAAARLASTMLAESQKPVEGARAIGDDVTMCASAVMLADVELRRYDRRRAAIFLRVVGVLLPEVRIALSLAIEQRNRPTA